MYFIEKHKVFDKNRDMYVQSYFKRISHESKIKKFHIIVINEKRLGKYENVIVKINNICK